MIHRDDAARALLMLAGPNVAPGIYNVCDNTPATQRDVYSWIAAALGKPLPPTGPADPHRKRGLTSRNASATQSSGQSDGTRNSPPTPRRSPDSPPGEGEPQLLRHLPWETAGQPDREVSGFRPCPGGSMSESKKATIRGTDPFS